MRELTYLLAFLPLLVLGARIAVEESKPETFYKAEVEHIHDGDSIRASFHIELLGVRTIPAMIRSDFDAWEVTRVRRGRPFDSFNDEQWQEEIEKGIAARDDLKQLLETYELYAAPTKQKESFGRPVMKWVAYNPETGKRIELAEWMQERGHVRGNNQ